MSMLRHQSLPDYGEAQAALEALRAGRVVGRTVLLP